MQQAFRLKRTTAADPDFRALVVCLDHELWNELKEDQATYAPFNVLPDIDTAIVAYAGGVPVACGCYKKFDEHTVEIKRMFVQRDWRGHSLSKKVLQALEAWAVENGYVSAVLETSIHFSTARTLYQTSGYHIIPNYPPYTGLADSVCMRKELPSTARK